MEINSFWFCSCSRVCVIPYHPIFDRIIQMGILHLQWKIRLLPSFFISLQIFKTIHFQILARNLQTPFHESYEWFVIFWMPCQFCNCTEIDHPVSNCINRTAIFPREKAENLKIIFKKERNQQCRTIKGELDYKCVADKLSLCHLVLPKIPEVTFLCCHVS